MLKSPPARDRGKISLMKQNMMAIVLFAALSGLVIGCLDDDESAGIGQLRMYLVAPPAGSDSVVLVVREVSVYSESRGWVVVNNTTRTFGLLQPANGARAALGETSLEAGRYTRIRLLLDTASHVFTAGTLRPIAIPGELATDTKRAVQFQINANLLNELYLDFDTNGSACPCECCRQFTAEFHVYENLQALRNDVQRKLKATKGSDRCKCGDRWDHRRPSGKHCRHCTPIRSSVGVIG